MTGIEFHEKSMRRKEDESERGWLIDEEVSSNNHTRQMAGINRRYSFPRESMNERRRRRRRRRRREGDGE
jgi:hypothetical protein